jgi:putative hydrolase of the HAD superfamily
LTPPGQASAAMDTHTIRHLFIDADDTLWENNIYFERAFARFAEFLDHSSLTAVEVRARLDEIENVNRRIYGYGAIQFGRNLRECFEQLAERPYSEKDLDEVMSLAGAIMREPIRLLDGVERTLAQLSLKYHLAMFTKGDVEEQSAKVESSGLRRFFDDVAIVSEKNEESFRQLLASRQAAAGSSCMIGNSPASDINPALAIGMKAVFIPHDHNWHLENEDILEEKGRFLHLDCFGDLLLHF